MVLRTRVRAGWLTGVAISLLAATLFTLIQVGEQYVPQFIARFGEPIPVSIRVPHGVVALPGHRLGAAVTDSHLLVPRGTVLSPARADHVAAHAYEKSRRPPGALHVLGTWALFFTLYMALTAFLRKFGQNRLRLVRTQLGLFAHIAGLVCFAKLLLLFSPFSAFWMPTAVISLWIAASFDRRAAMLVAIVTSFIIASLLRFDLLLLCVSMVHGVGAVMLLRDKKHSKAMAWAGALGGMCALVLFVALVFVLEGRFDVVGDLSAFTGSQLLGCVGGGALAGVISSLLRSPAERLLGHVPRERLHDLTDLEQPLLKRMAREAPGSWEHSRAMANLAEQAASAIGVDALLVRVGAYYHDLGKSIRPRFFVENLPPGEPSPHDELEPDVSADAILAHVVEGTRILREGGIPEAVVEFAYTHHGTQVVEYFWNKCKQAGNPRGLSKEYFRYPGMTPQTKETAILMLVDSIEAASRTVDPPERDGFETMVQRIVFTKLATGQLDDSGLRMRDLNIVVTRMVDTLVNMNHHRIKYPWQAKQAEEFGVPARAVTEPKPPPRKAPDGTPSGPAQARRVSVAGDSSPLHAPTPAGTARPIDLQRVAHPVPADPSPSVEVETPKGDPVASPRADLETETRH